MDYNLLSEVESYDFVKNKFKKKKRPFGVRHTNNNNNKREKC